MSDEEDNINGSSDIENDIHHPLTPTNSTYKLLCKVFPLCMYESCEVSDLDINNCQYSNKAIFPDYILSALFGQKDYEDVSKLSQLIFNIEFPNGITIPMTPYKFDKVDIIYIPNNIFETYVGDIGMYLNISISPNEIPKAEKIVLEPYDYEFMKIKDQRELLQEPFHKYSCLKLNQVINIQNNSENEEIVGNDDDITIDNKYILKQYNFQVLEIYPGPIASLIDVDLEVEFKIPESFIQQYGQEQKEIRELAEQIKRDYEEQCRIETENAELIAQIGVGYKTNDEEIFTPLTPVQLREKRLERFKK
jgi:hypothetical protein